MKALKKKTGKHSAGAGRQYNGRLGKIEMSQVGVFLALVTPNVCTWIDGELFLPKDWLEDNSTEQRKKVGLPEGLSYQTKPEIGWELIKRTQERQIPFLAVVMDDLYGRNQDLRQNLNQVRVEYYGDIPADTKVYLEKPQIVYPVTKRGIPSITPQIIGTTFEVRELRQKDDLEWQTLRLRANERGHLEAKFARLRVWLVYDNEPRQEWLLIRQDAVQVTYVLSNAPETIDLKTMA